MFVVFQGSKLQLIQSAMELKLNSVFSSATLGAGRLLPVRGAGHFAGGPFQNLVRFGGGIIFRYKESFTWGVI